MRMSECTGKPLYIWQDLQNNLIDKVTEYLGKDNKDLVILNLTDSLGTNYGTPLAKYIGNLCSEYGLLDSGRTIFLNYKDHLLALELCISRLKLKSNIKEEATTVDKMDVLRCHEAYIKKCINSDNSSGTYEDFLLAYDEFLKLSNCLDLYKLVCILRRNLLNEKLQAHISSHAYLLLGAPESEVVVELIKVLSTRKQTYKIIVETPLNISLEDSPSKKLEDVNVYEEQMSADDLCVKTDASLTTSSATQEYAEEIILSFLSLLVNCRNELALSKAMISPIINLSHSAFTDLKHLSLQKEMSMCQTVMSYVTRIRLGGKGYAPPTDCPLRSHLKALGQFVDLLNQQQTIVEEDTSGSAVKRVINIIKKRLLKSDHEFKADSVEKAASDLIETSILLRQHTSPVQKVNQIGQESLSIFHDLVNYKGCCYKPTDAEVVLEQKNLKRTPLNLPPLLGYFRSPDVDDEESMNEDTQASVHSLKKLKLDNTNDSVSVKSYFHNTESNSVSSIPRSLTGERTPTKTTFHGCLSDTEDIPPKELSQPSNERRPLALINHQNKVNTKRPLARDESVIASKKIINAKSKKQIAAKKPKGKVQIKGQGHITSFFTKK